MIGITLSSEQIRTAPPEVRRWIERQVATSLGLQIQMSSERAGIEQLAICSVEELGLMLRSLQDTLPAVNVLFELGRPGASFAQGKIEGYRLSDIGYHARLQSIDQVVACLNLINDALHRVRGAADAAFYGLDRDGHCFIATQTQQNILRLWQDVIGAGRGAFAPTAAPPATPATPEAALPADGNRPTQSPAAASQRIEAGPRYSSLPV